LHSSLVAPVLAEQRKDIEWMEARLGASLAEDLAAHDDVAIHSEEELLRFTPESLQWLAEQLDEDHAQTEMSPTEVADRMHQLRVRLAAADREAKAAADAPGTCSATSGPSQDGASL